MKPKVMAFYLPQFHEIPENNEWWGKGFTDWESARKARPLFPGHNQPRIPARDNYYNLLERSAMEWQAELARKAGIYGFCIYHYWFGEKQLLEKPAENLLKWKDIKIRYCFSWANESWICSWSKFTGNAWVDTPGEAKAKGQGLLVEQTYGNETEWERHFRYLLPFFQDRRYIKKDNKPVFVIYRPFDIEMNCIRKMVNFWNELAVENGFAGIFFVGTNCDDWKKRNMNALLQYEPNYTMHNEPDFYSGAELQINEWRESLAERNLYFPEFLRYGKIWKSILRRKWSGTVFPGGIVDFDSSPRKGKRAVVLHGATPEKFYRYFLKLYQKCKKNKVEFIFLTAWNEWGEGAYLEPDTKYGVSYLNAVRKCIRNAEKTNQQGK